MPRASTFQQILREAFDHQQTRRGPCRLLLAALMIATAAGCTGESAKPKGPSKETIEAGRRLFDERCKTVAGQKIYRTVDGVEGIVLVKLRHEAPAGALDDKDWPGAAFAREAWDEGYIKSFLAYEVSNTNAKGEPIPINPPAKRGGLRLEPRGDEPEIRPGYRYVDVQDDVNAEQWWRYYLVRKPRSSSKIGWVDTLLERKPAPADRPR
jgi:hypothetical protein